MALTDQDIDSVASPWDWLNINCTEHRNAFARAIESAACAERDARIAEFEKERDEWKHEAMHGGNAQYLREKVAELERQLAEARKDAERWVHACKCNNKNINVSAWDNDAMEFVGYAMKKEAIDAIADAEIAAMQKG